MNRFYAHADAGDPEVRLNNVRPDDPFIVIAFGRDWEITSKDPGWCRHVATAWTRAAELLESIQSVEARQQPWTTAQPRAQTDGPA